MNKMMAGAMLTLTLVLASCSKDAPSHDDGAAKPAAEASAEHGAAEKSATAAMNVNDPNVMKIAVPTMQCESCAETITKGVRSIPEAEDVNVDVEAKTVFVKVANNNPEMQKKIEAAIAQTGYSTPSAQRNAEAYKKLPECCQEGGMEGK